MASYDVRLSNKAQKALESLELKLATRIIAALEILATNPMPRNSNKLHGSENTHRLRIGDYRVIYEMRSSALIIFVIRIGHRRDTYR